MRKAERHAPSWGCGCRYDSALKINMDGLSGWEQFFDELDSFIRSVNRQRGTANEDFSEYVVERLEMCSVSHH